MTVSLQRTHLPRARRRAALRWLKYGFSALGALCILALLTGQVLRAQLVRQYPPHGRLVDIGGYRLHLACTGAGGPTVVMDAGANDVALFWARVQPGVAQFTRVCAYDRAGLGWSEPSPRARTSPVMARELHTLLERAGEPGPYVLVGHSLGGLNMRLFAQQYPAEVAGLVLVDAAHEAQDQRLPHLTEVAAQTSQLFGTLSRLSGLGLLALAPGQIPTRDLPAEAAVQYQALLASGGSFAAAAAETAGLGESLAAARAAGFGARGPYPIVILSRGQPEPRPGRTPAEVTVDEQIWRALQNDLAARTGGAHLIAERSGHYIQLQQPDLVIAAIQRVIGEAGL